MTVRAVVVQPGGIFVEEDAQHRRLTYTSTDGSVGLVMDVDSAYIVDGQPLLDTSSNTSTGFPGLPAFTEWIMSSVTMCPMDLGHWSIANYDPALGFLFNAAGGSPPSGTPSNRKSGALSPVGIAMISVFVPVLVLIIIGAVIIFVVLPSRREDRKSSVLKGNAL